MNTCKFRITLLLITTVLFISSCKKNCSDCEEQPPEVEFNGSDQMTAEESLPFELKENQKITLKEVKLPNEERLYDFLKEHDPAFLSQIGGRLGRITEVKGTQTKKNILVAKMLGFANSLISTNQPFLNDGKKPEQTKIAYGLGAKDYRVRAKPSESSCSDELYALDCSGFLHHVLGAAGIKIVQGAAANQTADHIQAAIRQIPNYEKIEVKDEGKVAYDKLESGDIIYYSKGGIRKHIGIVLKTYPGKLMIYQSNGTGAKSTYNSDGSVKSKGCEFNTQSWRGPRLVELTEPMNWGAYDDYGVIRIVTDISGKWDFHVRCPGQSRDVYTLSLTFPTDKDGEFTQVGNGTDYTGDPIATTFNFKYDKTNNILNCTFVSTFPNNPNGSRTDKFSVKLLKDDTGYFGTTKVVNNNGCDVEVRLINKEE
jgi:hypothetical protein